jgi:hypothetical protein
MIANQSPKCLKSAIANTGVDRWRRVASVPFCMAIGLAGVSVIGLVGSAQPVVAVQASPSVWKVFASEVGGFNLLMPGEPIESKSEGVISYSVTREKESVTYTVSFTDFPVDPMAEKNGIKEAFNGIKDGIREEGGKILTEKAITIQDFPGQELRVAMPNGVLTRVRSYVAGKRLYLVMASTKNERSLKKSLEGFLSSFRITRSVITEESGQQSKIETQDKPKE